MRWGPNVSLNFLVIMEDANRERKNKEREQERDQTQPSLSVITSNLHQIHHKQEALV